MKTTCRKTWTGNLFQVLNLTPASRLNEVVTLKHPYFSLIIGAMASEYKDRPSKVLPFKCFASEKFCLILKNKMAAIANYLKIINML